MNGTAPIGTSPAAAVLEGRNLTKSFWVKQGRGPLARKARVHAVEAVTVRLEAGKLVVRLFFFAQVMGRPRTRRPVFAPANAESKRRSRERRCVIRQ